MQNIIYHLLHDSVSLLGRLIIRPSGNNNNVLRNHWCVLALLLSGVSLITLLVTFLSFYSFMIPSSDGHLSLLCLFVYLFLLCWVFVATLGLSLVAMSRGCSSWRCTSFTLRWLFLLQGRGSGHTGFSSCGAWRVVTAQGLSCSMECEICLDQGQNLCPLHWQKDSNPPYHRGRPVTAFHC